MLTCYKNQCILHIDRPIDIIPHEKPCELSKKLDIAIEALAIIALTESEAESYKIALNTLQYIDEL